MREGEAGGSGYGDEGKRRKEKEEKSNGTEIYEGKKKS